MTDVHVTWELLEAVERGETSLDQVMLLYAEHLRALCPTCDVQLQAFADASRERREPREQVDPSLARLAPRVRVLAERLLGKLRAQARDDGERYRRDLRELAALVEEDREAEAIAKVERARTRFRSFALAMALLDEARASLPDRPRRAGAFARLAERVALRLRDPNRALGVLRGELSGLALAHQGNALRAVDDLRGADAAFARARWLLDEWGVNDPEVLAEVDGLEGSLRRAQRRFEESERLLQRAVVHWTAAEEPLGLVRALLKLSVLYQHWSEPAKALAATHAALGALTKNAPKRLRLCAEHNRVDYLCDLGHFDVAGDLLEEARPLYREFDDSWTRLRLAWVEGRIAAGLGNGEAARERLEAAREGFAAVSSLYDTALVSLELAELHLAQGRPAEARQVAAETAPLVAALEVPRELAAALAQLRRAAAGEAALTAELLRKVARQVRTARPGG